MMVSTVYHYIIGSDIGGVNFICEFLQRAEEIYPFSTFYFHFRFVNVTQNVA